MAAVSLTDVLAVYGAVLSTAAVLAGYVAARRRKRTRLSVRLQPRGRPAEAVGDDWAAAGVRLLNLSEHAISVTEVEIQHDKIDGFIYKRASFGLFEPPPFVIAPHQATDIELPYSAIKIRPDGPWRVVAFTADGQEFASGAFRVISPEQVRPFMGGVLIEEPAPDPPLIKARDFNLFVAQMLRTAQKRSRRDDHADSTPEQ